ncbi:hypothetical protein Tco_1538898 [Tanacetum coccineum]
MWQSRSSSTTKNQKCTIESRAMRSSINLIRTLFQYTCVSHTVKTRIILRVLRIILLFCHTEQPSSAYESIHSEDGNPARANIKQALGLHKDGDADASFHFRNSDKYYHDPEEGEHLLEHHMKAIFRMVLYLLSS